MGFASLRRTALALVAGVLLAGSAFAMDREGEVLSDTPSGAAMAFDLVIVRPVSFVATLVGATIFVVSLPFAAIQGEIRPAAQALVVEPARFTFMRPLGSQD
jgi:hypothetical protein